MAKGKATAAERLAKQDSKLTEAAGKHRGALPLRILSVIAKLGDQPPLRLVSGAVALGGLALGNPRISRAGVRMLIAHQLATTAKNFVKDRVDRTRPNSARDAKQAKVRRGDRTAKEHTSFPSGHSAGAVAVAQAFAREFPDYRTPALAAAGIVALGQVPKRAHYPTDVAAGALIGAASEAVISALWRAPAPENAVNAVPTLDVIVAVN